jgi:integrase
MELKGKITVIRGGRKVVALKPGRYAAGRNVYLQVTSETAASWIFMHKHEGKRREYGLGSFIGTGRAFTLDRDEAQAEAEKIRAILRAGQDPRAMRAKKAVAPTLAAMLDSYLATKVSSWKGGGTEKQWRQQLGRHCARLLQMPVDLIGIDAVKAALLPIWTKTLGDTQRMRIEALLGHAEGLGHRPEDSNPATWDRLKHHLPAPTRKGENGGHPALPYAEAPAFTADLAGRPEQSAKTLQLVIYTGGRANEIAKAQWSEFDFDAGLWTVPAVRMKGGKKNSKEHLVPLSRQAITLLQGLPRDNAFVFPQRSGDKPINNSQMNDLIERMGLKGKATPHGFRSTFRDWTGDETGFDREAIEFCLAHQITNTVEAAYRRGSAVKKRRDIMQAWADYVTGTSNVVQLRGRGVMGRS